MMAPGSEAVSFKKYGVAPVCGGCGRKLVKKDELAMTFVGWPLPAAVYGSCCLNLAAKHGLGRRAAA